MKKLNLFLILMVMISLSLVMACSKDESKQYDQEKMDQLLERIQVMAQNSTCNQETELKYISYGKKGCGGPTGYLVYTTSINVAEFTKLIAEFNEVQANFNKKWSIITSDCMIATPPRAIQCVGGKPIAIY